MTVKEASPRCWNLGGQEGVTTLRSVGRGAKKRGSTCKGPGAGMSLESFARFYKGSTVKAYGLRRQMGEGMLRWWAGPTRRDM